MWKSFTPTDGGYCDPASTWPPHPASIDACTVANNGSFVCTHAGYGYQCTNGCWAGFIDGPCAWQDAGVDGSLDAGP